MASNVNPLNTWALSKTLGESMEASFVRVMYEQIGVVATKANGVDKKNIDLRFDCASDVKYLLSPYPRNPTPAGLTPETHVTLDVANINKYPSDTIIWMVVDYRGAGVKTCGLFWTTAGKVQTLMELFPKRVYSRSARTFSDKVLKVAVSTEELASVLFPGMTATETVDALASVLPKAEAA